MLGDTSLMFNVYTYFPEKPRYWLWDSLFIVDTVLFSEDTGFFPPHFFDSVESNVYIGAAVTISAEDGHMQDFVTTEYAFVDNEDNIMTSHFFGRSQYDTTSWYVTAAKWKGVDVDNHGNFIGITGLSGYFFNDSVRAMCYLINNKKVCEIPRLPNNNGGNKLFVKFSPHFDSLLTYAYLFDYVSASYGCNVQSMKIDSQGNVYVSFYLEVASSHLPLQLTFAGNHNMHLDVTHNYEGFIVKLSPDFVPLWVKHLRSDYPNVSMPTTSFYGIAIDEDSNAVLVAASAGGEGYTLPVIIDSTVIDIYHAWLLLRFDIDDGHLVSFAKMDYNPAPGERVPFGPWKIYPQMAASNGRVWCDIMYHKGFCIGDTDFFTPDAIAQTYGEGILVLDYQGNLIDFMDFRRNVRPAYYDSRFLVQHDSVLLLGYYFGAGEYSWFGDSCVMANDDIGVIARYVDPAFAVPYGHQPPVAVQEVDNTAQGIKIYPNPTTETVSIGLEGVREVWLVAPDGRRRRLPYSARHVSLAAYPPGVYLLEVHTVDAIHTAKVIKMAR